MSTALVAFLLLAAETPMTADTPRATATDAVIVAARDFLPALEPLIQQRQRQAPSGLRP